MPHAGLTDPSQPQILLLTVDDLSRPWVRLIVDGFREVSQTQPRPPAVYVESLDASRFGADEHFDGLRLWLAQKYRDRHLDLIVAVGLDSLRFLAQAQGEPWPQTPVLSVEVGRARTDFARNLANVANLVLENHFGAALQVVKQILPDTERVALVYGASDVERNRWASYAGQARVTGLDAIELAGLSMDAIVTQVSQLPERTVVFLLAPYVDANGRTLPQAHACEVISSAANRPSFSLPAHDVGCGVVGGLVRDFSTVGRLLAEHALHVVATRSVQSIVVPIEKYTTLTFDARQLARWDIGERRLPAGSLVQFREPNVWRDYRGLVVAAATFVLLQATLIGALLLEHRRRRRAEVTSRQHLAAMAHLDRRAAMGELTTSLAHELNQPLNAILQNAGAAEMMLASKQDETTLDEVREILADIRSDDVRAGETIRRMRGLLSKREVEAQLVDVNDLAHDTVALISADAAARQVRIETALSAALPPVHGDRIHLQQVLLNLMLNGMEAMSETAPERRELLVRTSKAGGFIEVSVRDRGTGIADGDAHIFEPFYTTKPDGMGMGLSIARSIIEAHDGRITAENNGDGGATVRFRLAPKVHPDGHERPFA